MVVLSHPSRPHFFPIVLPFYFILRVVSSTFSIVEILVHSHFDLVSCLLAIEATEPVSEPVTQMALIKQSSHFSTAKEIRVKATFFFM